MPDDFDYAPRRKRDEEKPSPPRKSLPVDEEPVESTPAPAPSRRAGGDDDYAPRAPRRGSSSRKERAARRETGGSDYAPRPPRGSTPARSSSSWERPIRRPKRGKSDNKLLWRIAAVFFLLILVVPTVLVAFNREAPPSNETVAALQATLAKDSNDFDALTGLGNYYFNQATTYLDQNDAGNAARNCAAAIPYYERALQVRPEDSNVRTDLGTMYFYEGRLKNDQSLIQQAVDTWQTALSYEPDKVQTLLNLGLGYATLGQTDQAVAEWQRVIEVAPGTTEAETAQGFIEEYSTQPAAPTPTP